MQEVKENYNWENYKGNRLICVDDEKNVLGSLFRVFRKMPGYISLFDSAKQALQIIPVFRPQVVLADYYMPEMNGCEFLEAVKGTNPEIWRFMLSGNVDYTNAMDIAVKVADKILSKPWEDDNLRAIIEDAFKNPKH